MCCLLFLDFLSRRTVSGVNEGAKERVLPYTGIDDRWCTILLLFVITVESNGLGVLYWVVYNLRL